MPAINSSRPSPRSKGRPSPSGTPPIASAADAVVRHTDRTVLQRAINRALKQRCNLFFPPGRYRIPGGLTVSKATSLCLRGSGANTVLDISDGEGACFTLLGGTEVTIRDFTMVGHTGLAQAPQSFRTASNYYFWPNSLRGCQAVGMSGTERVLIENVHVSRMASEAFYAQGPARAGATRAPGLPEVAHLPALLGHRLRRERLQQQRPRREHQHPLLPG